MKTTNRMMLLLAMLLIVGVGMTYAQEAPERPQYITVTTMHWNMDLKDFKMDEWKAVEKEFLDKVTSKNEHVVSAGFYLHRMTPDNTELLYVQAFPTWNDIDLAAKKNGDLIEAAWPNEKAREAFFDKRNKYYSAYHSDEIYATMPNAKLFNDDNMTENKILYVRTGHFAYPKDGNGDEFRKAFDDYALHVFHKNEYIKGYYPQAHAYGADRTVFVEAFILDSMADLEKMFDRNDELVKSHWKDEADREKMNKLVEKYFTPVHSDAVYTVVAGLRK
ncbi:hypothetical protein [Mangrovimonas sp. YM274]|uniref:hypothetical protein n=1 Tax=Mangrovimonas sp. YM274 TaxID=3070660 RepID=UPI0027DD9FEE|nr:hypothetical protein [Mangrovimonas sp. YM274]WMI68575.1 hypothetical protein RBH95_15685 [Mangrovimonas sp. YM274]